MTEVVIAEDDGIGTMELNEEDYVKSLCNICNSINYYENQRSFFTRATLIFILIATYSRQTAIRNVSVVSTITWSDWILST